MPSLDARHLNASSSLPTRSIHGSFQPAAKSGWHGSRPSSLRKSERRQAVSIGCSTQIEFCDNLIFRRRAALDNLGERLLDANRTIGQPNKITVIFGRRISKHHRGKLQTEIEDMHLPNPVIRSHYGNGFIKQYVRDHL